MKAISASSGRVRRFNITLNNPNHADLADKIAIDEWRDFFIGEVLRTGLSLGMTLIDTSGNYGEGRSEELIKRVIVGQRDRVFLVSKVEADDANREAMARACEASLTRLGTDYLDLYLLHFPVSNGQFPEVVAGFERLRAASKIRSWGVSNFSVRSVFKKEIVARPIRSLTASVTAPLNVTYCHGASSTVCR